MKRIENVIINSKNNHKVPYYYFKYDNGTILKNKISGELMIYLFSKHGSHYGVWEENAFADSVQIVAFTPKEFDIAKNEITLTHYALNRIPKKNPFHNVVNDIKNKIETLYVF